MNDINEEAEYWVGWYLNLTEFKKRKPHLKDKDLLRKATSSYQVTNKHKTYENVDISLSELKRRHLLLNNFLKTGEVFPDKLKNI